ncbi:MAG: UDP-glucose/GDP-mannose dehydrogenase family protein [Rikenellaceae bacterium]
MKIVVVGTGYVGLVTGACFAEVGVTVICVDVNKKKIEDLKKGILPIYEPGLEEVVKKNVAAGRLSFTTQIEEVVEWADIIFSAVGTPSDEDGSADLKYVMDVARSVGMSMKSYKLIVTKSTVPVGTAIKVKAAISEELEKRGLDIPFDVASNPEFLKEGAALKDFLSPDRVVIGVESERAKDLMQRLYKPFMMNNFRVLIMDIPSAEMTKYAANAMLALRISFMNEIANLCEKVGADVTEVRRGIGSDPRIGKSFLYPGCGYGGSCFPKDVKALIHTGQENECEMTLVNAAKDVNDRQKGVLFDKLIHFFGSEEALRGRVVALWGLSFKPETDDMREAPSLVLIEQLKNAGAVVRAYDPIAMDETRRIVGKDVVYCQNIYDASLGADAVVVVTEWKEFRIPFWDVVKRSMRGNLIIDGRNIFDIKEMAENGFAYSSIGRKNIK